MQAIGFRDEALAQNAVRIERSEFVRSGFFAALAHSAVKGCESLKPQRRQGSQRARTAFILPECWMLK